MLFKRALNVYSHQERATIPRQLAVKDNTPSESIFDPFYEWSDESCSTEIQPLEPPTKKEQHDYSEELAKLRSEGCAPVKRALSVLMEAIQSRAGLKTSLSSSNVTLFNFHSTKFAERLVQRNVNGLVMVESSHMFSMKAKKFAEQQQKIGHNVRAYRADLASLLGIGRKKLLQFPAQLFPQGTPENSLQFASHETEDESGCRFRKSPILVSVLPMGSQQAATIEALKKNVIMHHAGFDQQTMYRYGAVEFLTFLDVVHLSHLLCSTTKDLDFYSHSIRRNSTVFQKLFDMRLLRKQGFLRTSFYPAIPKPIRNSAVPHSAKLEKLSLNYGYHYAVSIKPRTSFSLNGQMIESTDINGNFIHRDFIFLYSFWMNEVSKFNHQKKLEDVLKVICPESSSEVYRVLDKNQKIGDVTDLMLEKIFLMTVEEIRTSAQLIKYQKAFKVNRESKSS